MSGALYKVLQSTYNHKVDIDVFVNSFASDILYRMREINQVIINPFPHKKLDIMGRISMGRVLRKNKYDEVFILPNSFKSAVTPFFAKIKKRTGFLGEFRYGLLNNWYKLDKIKLPRMVDRFCALSNNGELLSHIPHPTLEIDKHNQKLLIDKFNLADKKIIAFCPGAEYGLAKRWQVEHFGALSDMLVNNGYHIIILGSKKDAPLGVEIITHATHKSHIINLCGDTTLCDVIDLLALSACAVTNDSGLMHVSAALNIPLVAIYGSSSPDFTPPLSKNAKILQIKLDCSPCFERTCKFGDYNCLRNITPSMVYDVILNGKI